jgi:glycine hydroxymethyltransferase
MIICREEHAKKINSAVFLGQQGGPLEHVIAGKAVALKIAAGDVFRERQERTLARARAIADGLAHAGHGIRVLTGGTDVHLVVSTCASRRSTASRPRIGCMRSA